MVYLVFQPMNRYLKPISCDGNGNYIYYWQSKGFSDTELIILKRIIIALLQT